MKDKIVAILKKFREQYQNWIQGYVDYPDLDYYAEKIAHLYSAGGEVSDDYIRDAIGIVVDSTRFHDVRLDHILKQKEALTDELVSVFKKLTRPTVSEEEELEEIFANHADDTPYLNFNRFKAAIKELLNR